MKGELKAGRYQIEQEIGRGGMGVVYRARDTRLKRTVALKMLPAELTRDAELRRRLAQEARAASAISHPGVATIFDYIEHGDESFIVFEYVEGPTLRERLNQHRFTTEEVLEIGNQISDALFAAHERGIVHRDLKPENVILVSAPESGGRVKILDFGLAKRLRPLAPVSQTGTQAETAYVTTAPGLLVGTVNYMSPEQLATESVDARTDLYAAGLVMYELATGANPFVGTSPTSTIANILTREPPPVQERNPVTPPELDRIVRKCLRKRREERYQSARELQVDLSNLRRDLTRESGIKMPQEIVAATAEAPLAVSRGLARALFLFIQAGYLVMYGVAFAYLPNIRGLGMRLLPLDVAMLVVFTTLCGTAVRLYLLSAVGFDYPDTGRLFRRVFPLVLLLDLAWALSPLLLFRRLGDVTLLFVAGLAYLPFSQRTLLFSAYGRRGGRTSGVRPAGSA